MSSTPFVLKREAVAEPFVAQVGDVTLTATHIGHVDQFELAEMFADDDITLAEMMVRVFRLAMDDENYEALRGLKLSAKELRSLFTAYQNHAGLSEGESTASSA